MFIAPTVALLLLGLGGSARSAKASNALRTTLTPLVVGQSTNVQGGVGSPVAIGQKQALHPKGEIPSITNKEQPDTNRQPKGFSDSTSLLERCSYISRILVVGHTHVVCLSERCRRNS